MHPTQAQCEDVVGLLEDSTPSTHWNMWEVPELRVTADIPRRNQKTFS